LAAVKVRSIVNSTASERRIGAFATSMRNDARIANREEKKALLRELRANNKYVVRRQLHYGSHSVFQFPIHTIEDLLREVAEELGMQTQRVKVQIMLSYLLQNVRDGTYRFFYASNNSRLYTLPVVYSRRGQLKGLLANLRGMQLEEKLNYPSSEWAFSGLQSAIIKIYRLGQGGAPLGALHCFSNLPKVLRNNHILGHFSLP